MTGCPNCSHGIFSHEQYGCNEIACDCSRNEIEIGAARVSEAQFKKWVSKSKKIVYLTSLAMVVAGVALFWVYSIAISNVVEEGHPPFATGFGVILAAGGALVLFAIYRAGRILSRNL